MKAQNPQFESASPHKGNPQQWRVSLFENINYTKMSPNVLQFRTPKLVKAKRGWYIEFYYQIPEDVKHLHGDKLWLRFQVREDLNRRKGSEKEYYAVMLMEKLESDLRGGFNPFTSGGESEILEKRHSGIVPKKIITAEDALKQFLESWKTRGLDSVNTLPKYERVINRLIEWLHKKGIPFVGIDQITPDHIEAFLKDMKTEHGFGNREYNNHYDFTRTAFKFFLKKKYITESPLAEIDKQKANTTKHRYYDEKSLNEIIKVLELKDPYTLLAFYTVYYLCVRSEKEIKNLRVGNIQWEQNKILADITKGKSERYINLDPHLKQLFLNAGIDKYPDLYYIFGAKGHPGKVPFGKGFFAKRFMKARDSAGLSKDFTLYGAKHTRVIHLKQDGASDSDIMSLTGHKDFAAYAKYLRDLGMAADSEKLNKISRKI